jgi:hypothetical protein
MVYAILGGRESVRNLWIEVYPSTYMEFREHSIGDTHLQHVRYVPNHESIRAMNTYVLGDNCTNECYGTTLPFNSINVIEYNAV